MSILSFDWEAQPLVKSRNDGITFNDFAGFFSRWWSCMLFLWKRRCLDSTDFSFYLFVIVNIYKQKIKTPYCFAGKRKEERFNACDTEILTARPKLVERGTYGPGRLCFACRISFSATEYAKKHMQKIVLKAFRKRCRQLYTFIFGRTHTGR